MKGLIKKDFLLLKSNLTYFIIVIFLFSLFSVNNVSFNISFMLPFISTMMFISTFNYDDFNNWNAYAITFPIGRKNIVRSKYISAFILLTISAMISILVSFATRTFLKNDIDIQGMLSETFGAILGLLIVIAIWIPIIYKFGVEKGRIILFIGFFGIGMLIAMGSRLFDFTTLINFLNSLEKIWYAVVPLVGISFLLISYIISLKIYLKKEF